MDLNFLKKVSDLVTIPFDLFNWDVQYTLSSLPLLTIVKVYYSLHIQVWFHI